MNKSQKDIDAIREFNRFYTYQIGLIDKHYLDSPFSLSEGRVLYELANMETPTARKIMERIAMDEGYLSRILDRFAKQGLLTKTKSKEDGRAYVLALTKKGQKQFAQLNDATNQSIQKLTGPLSNDDVKKLIAHMEGIHKIISKNDKD